MSHHAYGSASPAISVHHRSSRLPSLLTKAWFSLKAPAPANSSYAAIFARDNYRCIYCNRDLTETGDSAATIDHVIPQCLFISKGTANQDANRVACCRHCNQAKSDWTPSTRSHRAWYNRAYCLKFIAYIIRSHTRRLTQPS